MICEECERQMEKDTARSDLRSDHYVCPKCNHEAEVMVSDRITLRTKREAQE
jgi:anaerobic ribonucleoside-triphosphate reductase